VCFIIHDDSFITFRIKYYILFHFDNINNRQRYAEFFVKRGKYAVLLFDYRGFGSSDGEIRNLVDPWKHIEDWKSALAYLKAKPIPGKIGVRGVDTEKVAVWGTR
jgi:pimeloyl-ACP methyl ester carboxylesterase